MKDSFIDESLREHFADLLFKVKIRHQEHAYIGVLFEHKSDVDHWTAFQVLRYMMRVWDYQLHQFKQLYPILPIVVYHGVERWTVTTHFQDLFNLPDVLRPYVPTYQYWLSDLSTYNTTELQGQAELQAALLILKYVFTPELRSWLPKVFALWEAMQGQFHALGYLEAVIRYIIAVSNTVNAEEVRLALEATVTEGGALMNTIAQEWLLQGERRGEKRGLQQGVRQGLQQGVRQDLLIGMRLTLKLKFGLDNATQLMTEISQIEDTALLQRVYDGIESADTPEELRCLYHELPSE